MAVHLRLMIDVSIVYGSEGLNDSLVNIYRFCHWISSYEDCPSVVSHVYLKSKKNQTFLKGTLKGPFQVAYCAFLRRMSTQSTGPRWLISFSENFIFYL